MIVRAQRVHCRDGDAAQWPQIVQNRRVVVTKFLAQTESATKPSHTVASQAPCQEPDPVAQGVAMRQL